MLNIRNHQPCVHRQPGLQHIKTWHRDDRDVLNLMPHDINLFGDDGKTLIKVFPAAEGAAPARKPTFIDYGDSQYSDGNRMPIMSYGSIKTPCKLTCYQKNCDLIVDYFTGQRIMMDNPDYKGFLYNPCGDESSVVYNGSGDVIGVRYFFIMNPMSLVEASARRGTSKYTTPQK